MEVDRDDLRDYQLGDQLDPGAYVYFEVCDNGEGIDEKARDHIFDPFFSTKFTGRGLGLAVVLGIVKDHRGALRVDSSPAAGTRFRILLRPSPVAVGDSTDGGIEPRRSEDARVQPGTFLVVDDDGGVREITTILLERAGFSVLSAGAGAEAIEIFRKHAAEISCIVLDNTMPGLSGIEVFDVIREIEPGVPIIFTSGYSRDRIADAQLASGKTRFLHKPFDADKLLTTVHELLGTR